MQIPAMNFLHKHCSFLRTEGGIQAWKINISGSLQLTALFYLASPLWVSGRVGQDRTWTNICLISSSPWPRSGTPQELPWEHTLGSSHRPTQHFQGPQKGKWNHQDQGSPGWSSVTQGSLAGDWTWKWEGRDVRGSVHSFCSPTLVVSVELQYFPV